MAVRILTVIVLVLGVVGILISLLFLGFAALGYFGILADVGAAENRTIGMQFLSLALPPLIGGVVLTVLGLLVFAWTLWRADAKAGAAADGGGR